MPLTVLYPEERQIPDDGLEREIFGPDLRLVRRSVPSLCRPRPCRLRRGRRADDHALRGDARGHRPFSAAARDRADGRRLRQDRAAGRGGAQHPGLQRAGLRHDRGRRPCDGAGPVAAPRRDPLSRAPAAEPARALGAGQRRADPPARRADLRHHRARPHRHRGGVAGARLRFPGHVLRPSSAERRRARARHRPRRRASKTCCARPTPCRSTRR